jgi:hypothetical protein
VYKRQRQTKTQLDLGEYATLTRFTTSHLPDLASKLFEMSWCRF